MPDWVDPKADDQPKPVEETVDELEDVNEDLAETSKAVERKTGSADR
jgi:hypothetical protein